MVGDYPVKFQSTIPEFIWSAWGIWQYLQRGDSSPFQGTIFTFSWRYWGKPQKPQFR